MHQQYLSELDGLRGVAIIAVLGFHAGIPWFSGGFIGVDLFFVLSGFLITRLLVAERVAHGKVYLGRFYARRALRIGPALLLLLFGFCLASLVFTEGERMERNLVDAAIALLYVTNWARAFGLHPPDYLAHTWSLSIEEQFYLLWPGLLAITLRSRIRPALLIGLAVGLALASWLVRIWLLDQEADPRRLYNGLDTHASGLMIGCALGAACALDLHRRLAASTTGTRLVIGMNLGGLVLFLAILYSGDWRADWMFQIGLLAAELSAALMILTALIAPGSLWNRWLRQRWLRAIGRISYGVYLWHFPVYLVMIRHEFPTIWVATLGTLLTLLAAGASWRWLEQPALRFKHRFSQPRSSPR